MSLRDDLLRPEAFPSLHPARVELEETHISLVFLLERDVFKVKKPVDLGFLDFTTRETRKRACDAEVALNARLAPSVYRGVVPVTLDRRGRASIGGGGEIVDWAVHMRRLSDDRRADRRLARGDLAAEDVDAIATRVAELHAQARCDEETARFGLPAAIARNVEENFAQTAASIERFVARAEADEAIAYQRAFLRDHAARFESRAKARRVRDGHGDLRLEHVYFEPAPTIVDCIEFNDRFRYADVCADLAFLSMDFAAHDRVDLAERLLARYARASNDFDLYAVVDFYESYRAFVRGKISAMVASDEGIDARTRDRAAAEARRYFLLSLSAHRRALGPPVVVAVGGIVASGKSTIADCIGGAIAAPVVDADRTRKCMLGVEPTRALRGPAWKGAYDRAFTEEVYAEVMRRGGVVLASGRPVVFDASFRAPSMRKAARDLARAHGVPFRFVECRADLALCRARLATREREESVSDGRLEMFDTFRASFQPVGELPADEHVVLDTGVALKESLHALRRRIEGWTS